MADIKEFGTREEYESLAERGIASAEVFRGHLLHVFSDTVRLPDGAEAGRELIRHVGAVAVLPLADDGTVYVERQFRYPMNRVITEVPAGKLNSKTEDRLEAARRELREETGLTASDWLCLGEFYPSPAYTDEVITMYLARGLTEGDRQLDDDEFLNVCRVPLGDLVNQVMRGEIPDSKTQTMILKAAAVTGLFRCADGGNV